MSEVFEITIDQIYFYIQVGLGISAVGAIAWKVYKWYKNREIDLRNYFLKLTGDAVKSVVADNKIVEERIKSDINQVHNCVEKLEQKIDMSTTTIYNEIKDTKIDIKELREDFKEQQQLMTNHLMFTQSAVAEYEAFKKKTEDKLR